MTLKHNFKKKGRTIWITGLSGSGKTSLAKELIKQMKSKSWTAVHLDGDCLRKIFGKQSNNHQRYSRHERLELSFRYAKLARMINNQGVCVVVSTISMFEEIYLWNRKNMDRYFEVYLKVPLNELRKRDRKNIYSRFEKGEIKDVAGLDIEIDFPKSPDWSPKFNPKKTSSELACKLFEILQR